MCISVLDFLANNAFLSSNISPIVSSYKVQFDGECLTSKQILEKLERFYCFSPSSFFLIFDFYLSTYLFFSLENLNCILFKISTFPHFFSQDIHNFFMNRILPIKTNNCSFHTSSFFFFSIYFQKFSPITFTDVISSIKFIYYFFSLCLFSAKIVNDLSFIFFFDILNFSSFSQLLLKFHFLVIPRLL